MASNVITANLGDAQHSAEHSQNYWKTDKTMSIIHRRMCSSSLKGIVASDCCRFGCFPKPYTGKILYDKMTFEAISNHHQITAAGIFTPKKFLAFI